MTARPSVPVLRRPVGPGAVVAALAALVALASVLLLGVPAASAHGATGTMTITTATQTGPLNVQLEVGIKYENDDDLAEEAKVEATLTEADGTKVGPVSLPQIRNALYGTALQVPKAGTYAIAVTSTSPKADATGSVKVTGDPANGGSSGGSSSSVTTAGGGGASSTTAASATTTTAAPATSSTSSSSTPLVVAVVVVLVLVGAIGGFLVVRRKGS